MWSHFIEHNCLDLEMLSFISFFMYECSYDIEHQQLATDLKFSNNISVTHWNPGHEFQCRVIV